MALLPLPRRTRISGSSNHRLVRDVREGLTDLPPLPDLNDLVAAVLEVGAKHHPALLVPRRRPRRCRTAGVLLLVVAAGVLALAYRWWRGRDHDAARLTDVPAGPDSDPAETPPVPSHVVAPAAGADAPPVISPARHETPIEPARAHTLDSVDDCVKGEADTPPSTWARSTQPRRPQGVTASAPVRPQWRLGRGPSTVAPPVPAARPAVPGRPHPHLPR